MLTNGKCSSVLVFVILLKKFANGVICLVEF